MAEHVLNRKISIDLPRRQVFEFFGDAGNLESITPPELNFRITTPQPFTIQKGTLIDYKLKLHGLPITWQTLISRWDPPYSFIDKSLKSPYKQWIHEHIFTENKDGGTDIEDIVSYRLPLEPLGDVGHWFVRRELDYIFDYREKTVFEMLSS